MRKLTPSEKSAGKNQLLLRYNMPKNIKTTKYKYNLNRYCWLDIGLDSIFTRFSCLVVLGCLRFVFCFRFSYFLNN
jgi:hypothetical protein